MSLSALAWAGGPRYVAGSSYFSSAVMGQPLTWNGGKVSYYVDQGALSSSMTHTQAVAMVDAAATLWSSVSTAAVSLTDAGTLAENVTGTNLTVSTLGRNHGAERCASDGHHNTRGGDLRL